MITKRDVQDAYREGFQDGKDHGNLPYKYPPLAIAWFESVIRSGFFPPLTETQQELVEKWDDMSVDEKYTVSENCCEMTLLEDEPDIVSDLPEGVPLDSIYVVGLTEAPEMWWSDID